MIIFAFLIFSSAGLLFAYSLRVILSSKNLGHIKLLTGLAVNVFFMITHMEIAQFDKYLYFGLHPEIIDTYPAIGWIALTCFILHALALPVKRDLSWWWKKTTTRINRTDPPN
ncbi:hypothetical protein [Pseudomonas canadensis]|uniref:hypothetical protein n=1 Tax=Pseudomonas canadensis TaxID=915099 RepID=UPI0027349FD7|nr:hypothetical protein [Pseudomonas canadensis]WLH27978.1 hypothetical protein PSH56_18135 [Pseudomonas canadensis]